MIEIKDLLARFNNLLFSEEIKKASIINAIKQVVGLDIKSEDVKIKNNIIYLDIKPIYKNEIFLKQEQLFLALKDSLGEKTPQEIR